MTFQLIAFDMDDTLVDTFSVSVPNCVAMVQKEYGIPIQVADWQRPGGYRGKAGQHLLDAIEADYGVKIELEPFLAMRHTYLFHQLHDGMHVAPGIEAVLTSLMTENRRMCVCTNSVPERAALTLKNAITDTSIKLPDVFKQHVYSAVPTMRAKPAPDVYQHAVQQLGVQPHETLAVEDTSSGIQAAREAGLTAVGYVGLHDDVETATADLKAAGAHHIILHWDAFLPLLARLEG